jgi:hypothetical protein
VCPENDHLNTGLSVFQTVTVLKMAKGPVLRRPVQTILDHLKTGIVWDLDVDCNRLIGDFYLYIR